MTQMGDAGCCSWESMYSPFPAVRDNSSAWDSKMNFWMSAIKRRCISRKTAVFNLAQLHQEFQRFGRSPKCLGTVVQHMVSLDLARRVSFYLTELDPDGSKWSVWDFIQTPMVFSFNWFVRHPTKWVFRKLFSSASSNDNSGSDRDEEPYVIVDLVKMFADGIKEVQRKSGSMSSSTDSLVSYRVLRQMSIETVDDETSFRLALLHLSGQNRCSITTGDDGQKVVRFIANGEEFVEPSSFELKIFRLKSAAEKLGAAIDNITQTMERLKQSARESLNGGNQNEALRYLRRKKQLEPQVNSKEVTLERILALIAALEQAESHKQALDAYRSGIEEYKTMKQSCGLSVDEIDKTMLNMQEMFDDNHDMERTMSMAFNSPLASGSDDDELMSELNELLDGPSPPPVRQNNVTDPDGTLELESPRAASSEPQPLPLFKRSSSPRTDDAKKQRLQLPSVPTNDPTDLNPDNSSQHTKKSVKIKSEQAATISMGDQSNVETI